MLPYAVTQIRESQKVWLHLGLSGHRRWPLHTPVRSANRMSCAVLPGSPLPTTHAKCLLSWLLTYQPPLCDYLLFHLYQCCVTLHSLHRDGHGEFSHILSSCQMCLWAPESCLRDQLSTRPGAPSSPACPRVKQLSCSTGDRGGTSWRCFAYGVRQQGTEVRTLLQVNESRERHVL